MSSVHYFQETEKLRKDLLDWYSKSQRTLPWRTIAKNEKDDNIRGYSVWVSEIMLQQTQVSTVIDYYKKWMNKWPTMEALSKASLEEVNQAWAGLGYYSRGKRLWEGAKKIIEEHKGQLPQTAKELEKTLPGVGKYTASAIASIAFGEVQGLVDGNVMRVFSRMRKIGSDITQNETVNAFWKNAELSVCPEKPGDFNQALMELGATICTPKGPQCNKCPVKEFCEGKKAKDIEDMYCEDPCKLCLPKGLDFNGVLMFPRKEKKTKVTEKTTVVCILKHQDSVCLLQRPETGLLANLYELTSIENIDELTAKDLKKHFNVKAEKLKHLGEVNHQFSHISQKYLVWSAQVSDKNINKPLNYQNIAWIEESQVLKGDLALSTAMKKVFQFYKKEPSQPPMKKRKMEQNQPSIMSFMTKKKT